MNFRLIAVGKLRQPGSAPRLTRARAARPSPRRIARSGSRPMPHRTRRSTIARRLLPGDTIAGPAVIEQLDSTTLLFPGDRAAVDPYLNLIVDIAA